jgi:DNA modification methylase
VTVRILCGDCREVLKTLPDESVHCVVTSPPYWGLRDYGVPGQLGLQETPAAYVEDLVAVFEEAKRVLRADGTVWLNLGDTYASTPPGCANAGVSESSMLHGVRGISGTYRETLRQSVGRKRNTITEGLKPKDLVGIPWRVAFALQEAGWWLRQDIIWSKPNPMPESVRDRCTKAHEYLFLLSKSERYYFDQEAIMEPATFDGPNGQQLSLYAQGFARRTKEEEQERRVARSGNKARKPAGARGMPDSDPSDPGDGVAGSVPWEGSKRNKRSVWTVTTQPFKEAHFATFPPALIEPCILAGCPAGGTVLDPFGGAGTTGLVADRHGRDVILIELNSGVCGDGAQEDQGRRAAFRRGDRVRHWRRVRKFNPRASVIADRHYSRRKVGSPQFMPPGQTIILLSEDERSVFGWWRPDPKSGIRAMNGLDGWTCTIFRREGAGVASELILDAECAFDEFGYGCGPDGLITYVHDSKIESPNPGYCFKRAGYRTAGRSADGRKTLLRKPFEMRGIL